MNSLTQLLYNRRSIRKFTGEALTDVEIKELQRAALCAPTSKNCRSWEFVFVSDKDIIAQLSKCKEAGAQFLEGVALAVVIMADPQKTDVWVEDASIAATFIQLQAEALGLGSCWAQMRLRGYADGRSASELVKQLLNAPQNLEVECVIGIGHKDHQRSEYTDEKLPWQQIHINKF